MAGILKAHSKQPVCWRKTNWLAPGILSIETVKTVNARTRAMRNCLMFLVSAASSITMSIMRRVWEKFEMITPAFVLSINHARATTPDILASAKVRGGGTTQSMSTLASFAAKRWVPEIGRVIQNSDEPVGGVS